MSKLVCPNNFAIVGKSCGDCPYMGEAVAITKQHQDGKAP
jgi:hypothetical protein